MHFLALPHSVNVPQFPRKHSIFVSDFLNYLHYGWGLEAKTHQMKNHKIAPVETN